MFALLLALTIPILQAQPITRELSTRWHPTVAIETGLTNLAFVAVCTAPTDTGSHFLAVDSAGNLAELEFVKREWKVRGTTAIGERIVTGCAGAVREDQVWSLFVGTESGKVVEMRRGEMGWSRHEVTTVPTPIRAVRATDAGLPGPSQLFVIDGKGETTNWYVGASGRWNSKPIPRVEGGASHICFDYPRSGLHSVVAGPAGIIYKYIQDSMGNWSGAAWDTMSSGCRELAPSADPTQKDICLFYVGKDGHLRYLFDTRRDDVTSRLTCAEGAYQLIGKGDQRRFNEFFGMVGDEFRIFEYDPGQLQWVGVPVRKVPGTVVSTTFGPARGRTFHTIYVATVDGKIYEIERDGLENE
jgi:hypothetical protein